MAMAATFTTSVTAIASTITTAATASTFTAKAGIFICPDANTLYGFTENLELISGFPLVGYGIPAFADINGDKNLDCITITIDKKLNAWNLR